MQPQKWHKQDILQINLCVIQDAACHELFLFWGIFMCHEHGTSQITFIVLLEINTMNHEQRNCLKKITLNNTC